MHFAMTSVEHFIMHQTLTTTMNGSFSLKVVVDVLPFKNAMFIG